MDTKIICISGKARHGKDTVGDMLRDVLESDGHSVLLCHQGDLVKYICKQFFGWDGKKDEYGRTLLQKVGTDIIRKENPDYWVDFLIGILKFFPDEWEHVIIPDCRFPNEISKFEDCGFETIHVRVIRPGFDNQLTEEQKKHPSETSLDDVIPEAYICNNSTLEDLLEEVIMFSSKYLCDHQMRFEDYKLN